MRRKDFIKIVLSIAVVAAIITTASGPVAASGPDCNSGNGDVGDSDDTTVGPVTYTDDLNNFGETLGYNMAYYSPLMRGLTWLGVPDAGSDSGGSSDTCTTYM